MSKVFNPLIASVEDWELFLLDGDNHLPDYKMKDYPFKTELEKVVETVTTITLPAEKRTIIERVVEAALAQWRALANYQVNLATGGTHPFLVIPQLMYTNDSLVPTLVPVLQQLWHRAPMRFHPNNQGFSNLFSGFAELVPLDNEQIQTIFLTQFENYKFKALEVLLRRGDIERARRLFQLRVKDYPAVDPWCMDRLIYLGLPVKDAEVWLKQGINGEPSHKKHSAHSLRRWKKTAKARK